MQFFKELVSCRHISKSLLSARPFNFFDEEPPDGELTNRGPADTASLSGTMPTNTQVTEAPSHQLHAAEVSHNKNADSFTKVDALQVKLLRLIHRIGLPPENLVVAQVLYRLQLANLIRDGESNVRRPSLKIDRARAVAAEQEAGQAGLDFSFKILVLGKTGVGKSSTINSLFDQRKVETDAFQPSTDRIHEVFGSIRGIEVSVIDTPGLSADQHRNRKILKSVKRFIRKSPPDIVLYFERIDMIQRGDEDYPLLKLITEVFGSSIWFNTILVMTHSSSHPPEMSYDAFVGHCASLMQHRVHLVVSSTQIENPVVFVENHPMCGRNTRGEKILPNGDVWMSRFLLLCIATKVLGDANSLLKFQGTIQLTKTSVRLPSLPHLLSSFLRPRSSVGDDVDELDEDEDYDQLPPIRILTKAQYRKLSEAQRNAYLDELEYRETLFLKKQWKEEMKRRGERKHDDDYERDDEHVSDMALPVTFDSESPFYRYRCIMSNDQWLVRPVLDSQGWDHDVGFDGVSLEASRDMKGNLNASLAGQMSMDKVDFSIQSECAAKYEDQRGISVLTGFDLQSAGKDLVCTVRGDAKLRNLCCNYTGGGISVTSFGKRYYVGAKLEDTVSIGRRCQVSLNAGQVSGSGQVAHGGGLEATVRGKDHPVRDDKLTLASTLLSFDKETVIGGSLQSDFRIGRRRSAKMSVSANLNSRGSGQVCIRTTTSQHVEIALIGIISMARILFRRRATDA